MRKKNHITKAVFPVAGFGTRFLPITKTIPKEMLPIIDTPLIQYAVEEAVEAGINELIFITSQNKVEIEDYFDKNAGLETKLQYDGKSQLIASINHILPDDVTNVYIRQVDSLGLGHAVLCAKKLIGDESFAVILPDDLMEDSSGSCLKNMISFYEDNPEVSCVLAAKEVHPTVRHQYGIISLRSNHPQECRVEALIEKPTTDQVKSNLAILGRYILSPEIFTELEKNAAINIGELQFTDAISNLLSTQDVQIYRFNGSHFDCGNKLGFIKANLSYAMKRDDLSGALADFMRDLLSNRMINH